jgi:hypothetical protein
MKIERIILLLLLLNSSLVARAQDERTQAYLHQEEQRKKAELMRHFDSAIYFMDNEEHVLADQKFRYVLENVKSVPSDLTFFFGKNSYFLKKYRQSIDWLNKYIQLKGTTGQYYNEAIQWLEKSQNGLVKEKSTDTQKAGEILSSNYAIDCGPSGKVTCPVCKGKHVIIKKGAFGNEYKTCPYCNEHGVLTCDEYNKLLQGKLQKKH